MFIKQLIIQSVIIDYVLHEHSKNKQERETRNFTNSVIFDVCTILRQPHGSPLSVNTTN